MAILPHPVHVEPIPGQFVLGPDCAIHAGPEDQANAAYLQALLERPTGYRLRILEGQAPRRPGSILLRREARLDDLGAEGYLLEVTPQAVTITAAAASGVFHAIQSLRQLLPPEIESPSPVTGSDWCCPCLAIRDYPRFAWRGFMLDEGRHFHGRQAVEQLLDMMALYKLNVFHWHLTEDQGWRIEIGAYPRLTQVGSSRPGTSRSMLGRRHDGIPHAGFYTQADIRAIVAYAAQRHILVVPEIEFPGHSLAALAAYPGLSCSGGPFEVATHFGIFPDIYCAGKEATFGFLQSVLDELLELFPSPWIHIGGDEAPKRRWRQCPDCQKRIAEEGLKDEHALQAYFTNRLARYLEGRGRTIIGWNQILHPGLAESAVLQYWLGSWKELLQAIRGQGRRVIMSAYLETYLDHSHALLPLSRAYRYDPLPAGLTPAQQGCILGLEFPLWGEWLPTRERLHYQAFPRICALAETGWTPLVSKDWQDFRARLRQHLPRLDRLGIRYAPLETAEPPIWKQAFGLFSIPFPQRGRAPARQACPRHAE